MKTHVCGKDRVDHQFAHSCVGKCLRPVSSKDLGVSGTVERLQDRAVVVKLSKGSIEGDKKGVVNSRMTNVVTNGRNEKGESIKGLEKCEYSAVVHRGWTASMGIRGQNPNSEQKVKYRLKNVNDVTEIVVQNKVVIGLSTGHEKGREVICANHISLS